MPRYFTRARQTAVSYFDDPPILGTSITVHETEQEPIDTGLIDPDGYTIMREPERFPMGFDTTKRTPRKTSRKGRASAD